MKNKIVPLIIGADGLIGGALWRHFRSLSMKTGGTSRKGLNGLPFLDLRNPHLDLDLSPYTHAIIAGANPNIMQCEIDPAGTKECNVTGALSLAQRFAERGIQTVLFSTDYVFDGIRGEYTEEDCPSPLNEYGRQKAELEEKAGVATGGNYLMIRLAKVFLGQNTGKHLLGEMADRIRQKQPISAARDQVFSPVLLEEVVEGIAALMDSGSRGLYNLGGPEKWTRYDLVKCVATHLQGDMNLIHSISLDDLNEPFKRPKSTDLISRKFEQATGRQERHKLSDLIQELFR